MTDLDKRQVRHAFNRAAATYDQAAVVQRYMCDELLSRLNAFKIDPGTILDVGCGTAYARAQLRRLYGSAHYIGVDFAFDMLRLARPGRWSWKSWSVVCADAESLPVPDRSVDLIFCNALLQWCDPERVFGEFRRVLSPDGVALFSTFGPDTLQELRRAWAEVDADIHVHEFIDMHHLGDALVRLGFELPVMDMDYLTVTHRTFDACLRDLKAIGASNAALHRRRGLTPRSKLRELKRVCEQQRNAEGLLETTYEIVYGQAWGSARRQSVAEDGTVSVPLSELTTRL